MDLAKIRKKSLQTLRVPGEELLTPKSSSSGLIKCGIDETPAVTAFTEMDSLQKESCPAAVASMGAVTSSAAAMLPEHVDAACTPLEAILAGRIAAGCDDESILADDDTSDIVVESCQEFLCFRVSDETYGINIMEIKEIIKPREVTEVPRAPAFVSGVLSLRGTIIPIIDMRVRLGLACEEATGKERIVVVKSKNSFSGLMVDEVIQVVQVRRDAVEAAPVVLDGIDRDFISGIGRADGRLIIVLSLENITDINLY